MARSGQVGSGVALVALVGAVALACGGGPRQPPARSGYAALMQPGTRDPADAVERELLAKLETFAPGVEVRLDGSLVVAGPPYEAASGRTCRRVAVRAADGASVASQRLLCRVGEQWAFVPNVLRAPSGSEP